MSPEESYPDYILEEDLVLKTLSNPVRRQIIDYLENEPDDPTVALEELIDYLVDRQSTNDEGGLRISLTQDHLPTLESRGWLDFEPATKTITYHGHAEAPVILREIHDIFRD